MAKSDFQSKEDLKEYIDGLKEVKSQYESLIAKAKEFANTPGKVLSEIQKQIRELERQNDTYDEIVKSLKQAQSEYDKLSSKQEKFGQRNKKQKEEFDDLEDSLISIGSAIGKNTKLYETLQNRTIAVKETFKSIGEEVKKGGAGTQSDKVKEAAAAYVNMQTSITNAMNEQKLGNIDMDEYVNKIEDATNSFQNIVSKIDLAKVESKELVELLERMGAEGKSFTMVAKNKQLNQNLGKLGEDVATDLFKVTPEVAEGIDGMADIMKGAFSTAAGIGIYDMIKGGIKVLKNAGAIASKLFNAPVIEVTRQYELQEKLLDVQISQTEQIAKLNAGIVADRANLAFSEQLEQGAAQFRAIC